MILRIPRTAVDGGSRLEFRNEKSSRNRQRRFSKSSNRRKGSGCNSLPTSMHTGQIIMLTKMITASSLRFYDFKDGAPVENWRSRSYRSS